MSYPLLKPKGGWRDSGMWDDGGSESDGDMPALQDPDDGSIGSDSDADLDLDDPNYASRNLHDSSSEPRLNGHADDGEAGGPEDYADSNDRTMRDSSKFGDDEARRLKNEHRNQQSRAKHNNEKIEEAPEDEAAEGEATEEVVDTTADTAAADTAVVEEGSGVAGAAEAGDVAGEAAVEPVVVEVIADGAAAAADGGAVGGAIGESYLSQTQVESHGRRTLCQRSTRCVEILGDGSSRDHADNPSLRRTDKPATVINAIE